MNVLLLSKPASPVEIANENIRVYDIFAHYLPALPKSYNLFPRFVYSIQRTGISRYSLNRVLFPGGS